MKTFVIADLHGRFDLLEKALSKIEASQSSGKIIFLGDYVDRGPKSRQVIERLRDGPTLSNWSWVVLIGNHELAMIRAWKDQRHIDWWMINGAGPTLLSYGQVEGQAPDPSGNIPKAHINWAAKLPFCHLDKHRIYVHAGVDHAVPFEEQSERTLTEKRYRPVDEMDYNGLHVVHGHTPHAEGPMLYKGRTNLDTMAFKTGRLVIGVFDDDKAGGPVDLIEVTDK